ncbi:hypothetical protein [Phenylobacterium sp.]|uniref:hypothetical protein n=1 Tax=Phenylobacterium sp. TaxID=1871053 RepID=UPI0025FA01CD|nr:hypothetical protein [Phenylobacterium sp.]
MRWTLLSGAFLACGLAACASSGGGRGVAAIVQDEQARQAAAVAVEQGQDADSALKQGAAAASPAAKPTEPPTP